MWELKDQKDQHTSRRVETHVIELSLLTAYTSQSDLHDIDTLLKIDIENLEQVSKIQAIIPADKCLGFIRPLENWLYYVNQKLITYPVNKHATFNGPDGKMLIGSEALPIKKLKE